MTVHPIPADGLYWTSTMAFIKLDADRSWRLSIRHYDGRDVREVHSTTGLDSLTDHVLGEMYDCYEALTDGLASRCGGIQHWLPGIA